MKDVEIMVELFDDSGPIEGFPRTMLMRCNTVEDETNSITTSYAKATSAGGERFAFFFTPSAGTLRFNGETLVEMPCSANTMVLIADARLLYSSAIEFKTTSGTAVCRGVRGD